MRRRIPTRIGELWSGFIDDNPVVARKLCEARIPSVWREVAGSAMASLTSGVEMNKDILTIRISSSVARHELFMQREQLRVELNKKLGLNIIKTLIIK